jgi:small redox-active disulfide protein 2
MTKHIQILGTGCPKCKKLAENTAAAADELGIEYEIEKVTDIGKILEFEVIATPALAIEGEVKVVGKVPSVSELKTILV